MKAAPLFDEEQRRQGRDTSTTAEAFRLSAEPV